MSSAAAERQAAPSGAVVLRLLLLTALVGLVVSLAAWGFLEGVHRIQVFAFEDLPKDLGYDSGAPTWWPLPVLCLAGGVVAFAIRKLPGTGGHDPAGGLKTGFTAPIELPGVLLAAAGTIGLGVVLGPEAPLIALGSGLGVLAVRMIRKDAPEQVVAVVATAGTFAAISFVFGSPLIGAVILIEAAGLDRRRLQIVVPTGLLAAGIGSLVSIGLGAWTGLSSKDFALGPVTLPAFDRPDVGEFCWTIPLAFVIAAVTVGIFRLARELQPLLMKRAFVFLPLAGLAIAGLAIAFAQSTDKEASAVLFSGQDALPALTANAATWSMSALAALIVCKGLAWSVSLAGFRGGPTFPGLYLGAAAGVFAAHLPGLALTPAVAVGMGAATAAALQLPLAAVVLATLLTAKTGGGAEPLIIVGVVVAFVTARALTRRENAVSPEPSAVGPASTP